MHLQAAKDLRVEIARISAEEYAGAEAAMGRQAQLEKNARLADILGAGGLPMVARLDVSARLPFRVSSLMRLLYSHISLFCRLAPPSWTL
jgi:hypothetical protein